MRARGRETRDVSVEIRASDFLRSLRDMWTFKVVQMTGDYVRINDSGDWENWESGPGSGYTVIGRSATQLELDLLTAFDSLICLAEREQY